MFLAVVLSSMLALQPLARQVPAAPPAASAGLTETLTKVNDKKNGIEIKRRSDGSIRSTTTWKNGVKEGSYREYSEKGACTLDGQYTSNEKTGVWYEWNTIGEIVWETPYVNGKAEGIRYQWGNDFDPKTKQYVCATVTYKDGVRQGPSLEWWPPGDVVSTRGEYDTGEKHGTWETFYSDGKPMRTTVYDHGKKLSTVEHKK